MKRVAAGVLIILSILLLAIIFSTFDSARGDRLLSPSVDHILGTDTLGRDLALRIGRGTLISLSIAFSVTAISLILGIALSFLFFIRDIPSTPLMTVTLMLKTVPPVLLALFLNALTGPGVLKLIIVLSLGNIADIAETAFSDVSVLRSEDYVLASIGLGKSRIKVFAIHVLPNEKSYLLTQGLSIFSASILSEASLSFLGCGVPVTLSTLGSILSEARSVVMSAPWMAIFPSLVLLAIGIGLSLIVSGLSESDTAFHRSGESEFIGIAEISTDRQS